MGWKLYKRGWLTFVQVDELDRRIGGSAQ